MPSWLPPVLAAPFVGSFLGVLIRRLPRGESVALSRSHCESCGRTLGPAELVPLASYTLQGGRCRGCAAPIGRFHLAVELAALLVAAVAVAAFPWASAAGWLWGGCVLGWGLLALAWIDWEWLRLPDALTLPLILLGLGFTAWLDAPALPDHAIGAVVGYLAFRAIALAYRALRGREGLGRGDATLLAAGGAWLGWQALPLVVLGAAAAALALVGVRALRGRSLSAATAIPFGPALALAIWVLFLAGAGM